jgi:hypothetical protein
MDLISRLSSTTGDMRVWIPKVIQPRSSKLLARWVINFLEILLEVVVVKRDRVS